MKKKTAETTSVGIPDEVVLFKIYEIRDEKVMLDRDLSPLFDVETKVLKQAVRRNLKRFPNDFMFEMNEEEFENWRSQFVTSKEDMKGLRYAPFCFTEQGITMLSCVLNSQRAIEVNLRIVRVFVRIRKMLLSHKDLLIEIKEIRKKLLGHDEKIELILDYLTKFVTEQEKPKPRPRLGFKQRNT